MFQRRTFSCLQKAFDSASLPSKSALKTGLFGYNNLSSPIDYQTIVDIRIKQADKLVELITSGTADKTVQRIDRVSDLICSVVDNAELIRHVHPNQKMAIAADTAYNTLSNYMNSLNTNQNLYSALLTASKFKSVNSQQNRVCELLIKDFENCGIHMTSQVRDKYVEMNSIVADLSQSFIRNCSPSTTILKFNDPESSFKGIPKHIVDSISTKSSPFSKRKAIVQIGPYCQYFIANCDNQETRRKIHIALNSGSDKQLKTLDDLVSTRNEIGKLIGLDGFAEMSLKESMAKNPDVVFDFLIRLANEFKPILEKEIKRLEDLKRIDGFDSKLEPWDVAYYSKRAMNNNVTTSLCNYFSLGRTMRGISRLLTTLFGIKLVPVESAHGETWHESVQKLKVIDESDKTIGIIYADLFERPDKYDRAAHFTIRCARRIDQDEPLEDDVLNNLETIKQDEKIYQMPIVALIMSLSRKDGIALLNISEVETLFHEIGHCIHSMLSRTDFQHISGTRVAMDFVEVPSILNEYFSKSSLVLCSIGQDYQTLNQLSINELQSHLNSLKFNDIFETRDQIMLALQDLLIHSPSICRKYLGKETSSSLEIYKELHSKFGYFDFVDGTAALAQFSHLASYGACYYSYFWSRRLAERIYLDMFSGVSLNGDLDTAIERLAPLGWRRSGELIKTELLQVGGSRDPSIGLLKLNIRND